MKLEAAAITSPHRNQSDDSNLSLVSPKAPDTASGRIQLVAPLSGRLLPIGAVPDPVFAQKMVGDGVSLDPVSQSLVSPCDGTITLIHSAGHAVTITTAEGVEVLMHIGLDTVMLKGKGFTPRVKTGETVARGDVLIDFDADYVATHARSLLTQIVVTNMGLVRDLQTRSGDVVAGQDAILDIAFECATDCPRRCWGNHSEFAGYFDPEPGRPACAAGCLTSECCKKI